MKATTVKIDGNLLREVESACPPSRSLTSFVREVLGRDIRRRRLAEAAVRYETFLSSHPDEERWLSEWERSDLAQPLTKGKRKT